MKKIITYLLMLVILASSVSAMAQTSVTILNPSEESVIYEGEILKVQVSVADDSAYKIAFYLNNDWVSTASCSGNVECEITDVPEGENIVRADALSASGTVLATDSVTFNVSANEAPVIDVEGIAVNDEIELSETNKVNVSISDNENNFKEATVFLNGNELGTYTGESFEVDISEAASGKNILVIEAVDEYGNKGFYENSFNVKREIEIPLLYNDFNDYVSGTPSKFTNFVTNKGASYSAVTTEEEIYGTSLCLTANTIENSPDVDAHMYLGTDSGKQKFVVKASYYFPGNDEDNYDATATLYFRAGNGSARELVDFDKNGKLKYYGETGIKSTTYMLDTWYDLELYIDTKTGMYDIILNGEPVVEGNTNTHIRDLGISAFRFGICTRTGHSGAHPASDVDAKVYMDNISVVSIVELPEIEAVYSEGNGDIVSGGASEITAKLSTAIEGSDIAENIVLTSEYGDITVNNAVYDDSQQTVSLATDAFIQPGAEYSILIKKGTKITSTLKTDADIRYGFTAEADSYDVAGSFEKENGKLVFNGVVDNKTEEAFDAIAVMYVWQENKLVSAHTKNIAVNQNSLTEFTVEGKPLLKGERVTVNVFDKATLETPVTVKKYSYSN